MADLKTTLGSLTLKNPVVTGAGPLAGTADHIRQCVDAGFGAVCTKTTSFSPYLQRYPRPLYRLKDYVLNPDSPRFFPDHYMWFHRDHNSIFPPDRFVNIIKEVSGYCKENGTVLIGNFAGRGLEEWVQTVSQYAEAGCDAMELNFCCPFPPKGLESDPANAFIGMSFTADPERGAEVISTLKEKVSIPLFPKISPASSNFAAVAMMFEEAGADGLSLFANEQLLRIDIETGKPVNYGPCAGTSPIFKAHTMKWVSQVAQRTDLPILGGRGASAWSDVIEFLMAGADGVEMCTPVMLRGFGYVEEVLRNVNEFLDRKRIASLEEIKGSALKHIYSNLEMIEKVKALHAEIDMDGCIGCHRCSEVCVYSAVKVLPKKAAIMKEKCAGCSLCSQVCPVSVIKMHERDSDQEHFQALAWEHKELMPELFDCSQE